MSNIITGMETLFSINLMIMGNKVFKYFVLELIKNNDVNNLTDYEIFNLADVTGYKDNIEDQPECIKKLWNVWKQKNNYLFAYYLSPL